jgi:hypothetical protein
MRIIMRDLIATKPLVYAARRLKVGDGFTVRSAQDARVLIALRKAKNHITEIATELPDDPPSTKTGVVPEVSDEPSSAKTSTGSSRRREQRPREAVKKTGAGD